MLSRKISKNRTKSFFSTHSCLNVFRVFKIRTRLLFGFFVITLLVLVVGLFGIGAINQAASLLFGADRDAHVYTQASAEITSYAKRAEGHLALYLMFGNPVDRDKFPKRIASLNENIDILWTVADTDADRNLIGKLRASSKRMFDFGNQLIEQYQLQSSGSDILDLRGFESLFTSLHNESSIIRKDSLALTLNKSDSLAKEIKNATSFIEISRKRIFQLTLLSLLLAALFSIVILLSISLPMKELSKSAYKIAQGDLKTKINISGGDEITSLSESIEKMRGNLNVVMGEYEKRIRKEKG